MYDIIARYTKFLPVYYLITCIVGFALHDSCSNSCLLKYLNSRKYYHARLGIRSIKNVCHHYIFEHKILRYLITRDLKLNYPFIIIQNLKLLLNVVQKLSENNITNNILVLTAILDLILEMKCPLQGNNEEHNVYA